MSIDLPSTLVMDFPTVNAMDEFLQLQHASPHSEPKPPALELAALDDQCAIGITGMACILPGRVSDPRAVWNVLYRGETLITCPPPVRWQNVCSQHNNSVALHSGAFIEDPFPPQDRGLWDFLKTQQLMLIYMCCSIRCVLLCRMPSGPVEL